MKAFKSLEAYKYFVAGWVHGLQTWSIPEKQRVLVMAKVCQIFCCVPGIRGWLSPCLDLLSFSKNVAVWGALTLLIHCLPLV